MKKEERQEKWNENLFKSRSILLFGDINMDVAKKISAQLLALSYESTEPIKLYVNSPGGHVESGDTIHDMIKFVQAPVYVIGTGWVASAGALIFVAAKKENRFCLPNTRFLLHQPSGGMRGTAEDVRIQAEEIIKMRERLNQIFSKETGQSIEKISVDMDRDYWLSADDAKTYGLVHKIISHVKDIPNQ